jgi:RNA polymerase sigma factor (TIGR02999 family)
MGDVTQILERIESGDPSAAEHLLPLIYDELRKLAAVRMAQESPDHTLQATALVHEVYLRLVNVERAQRWDSRGHFFAAAAEAMRRILVEQARHRKSRKAGGGLQRIELSAVDVPVNDPGVDLLEISDALDRLAVEHPRKAELVKLRYFGGVSHQEAAALLGISASTADNDWFYAKSWLRVDLSGRADSHSG